jgi:hypothetical protein
MTSPLWIMFCVVNDDEDGVNFVGAYTDHKAAKRDCAKANELHPYHYYLEEKQANECEVPLTEADLKEEPYPGYYD